jgi:hypothetical protein
VTSVSQIWGTEPGERRLAFPCDRLITHPDAVVYRGVTVCADPEVVFRWMCQMRAAPYSYDWIDNRGRQSPRHLIGGMDQLAIGQDVMSIFDLADFALNQHLTIRTKPDTPAYRIFGDAAASYLIIAKSARTCRLLVKLVVKYPRGAIGRLMRVFLPWGDLIMMRRQLLNFKGLAEQTTKTRNGVPQHF